MFRNPLNLILKSFVSMSGTDDNYRSGDQCSVTIEDSNVKSLQIQNDILNAKIRKMSEEMVRRDNDVNELQNRITDLMAYKDSKNKQLTACIRDLNEERKAREEAQHFLSCLEDHKHRLTDRLTTAIKEVEKKGVEAMKLAEQVNQLKKELTAARMLTNAVAKRRSTNVCEQSDGQKKINDMLRERNQRLTIENVKLSMAKNMSDQQNKNKRRELKKLRLNLIKSTELLEQRTVVNNKQTDIINQLKIELSKTSRNTITILEKPNEEIIRKFAITQQLLEDQTKANADLKAKNESYVKVIADIKQSFNTQILALKKQRKYFQSCANKNVRLVPCPGMLLLF